MPIKDPFLWSASSWGLAVVMAAGGGLINWIGRVRAGNARPTSLMELLGEMATSGFIGIGVAMVLTSFGYDFLICAALAGIGGHMGTRLLFRIEHLIESRLSELEKKEESHD